MANQSYLCVANSVVTNLIIASPDFIAANPTLGGLFSEVVLQSTAVSTPPGSTPGIGWTLNGDGSFTAPVNTTPNIDAAITTFLNAGSPTLAQASAVLRRILINALTLHPELLEAL